MTVKPPKNKSDKSEFRCGINDDLGLTCDLPNEIQGAEAERVNITMDLKSVVNTVLSDGKMKDFTVERLTGRFGWGSESPEER